MGKNYFLNFVVASDERLYLLLVRYLTQAQKVDPHCGLEEK